MLGVVCGGTFCREVILVLGIKYSSALKTGQMDRLNDSIYQIYKLQFLSSVNSETTTEKLLLVDGHSSYFLLSH